MICLFERLRDAVPSFCSWWSWLMRFEMLPRSGTIDLNEWIGHQPSAEKKGHDEAAQESPRLHGAIMPPCMLWWLLSSRNLPRKQEVRALGESRALFLLAR